MGDTIPDGYMINGMGWLIPIDQVKDSDMLRHETVSALVLRGLELHALLAEYKQKLFSDISSLVSLSAEKYGVKIGGDKGNISITTFDGRYRLTRSVATVIAFSQELEAAKALIEGCIERWSDGADKRLKSLVMKAFKPTAQGELRTASVLALLKLEMKGADDQPDDEWDMAMLALRDSIQTAGTTTYINIYERIGDTDKYRHIPLDLAAV